MFKIIVGVPKEIKNNEYRVALTPAGVKELLLNDCKVKVEKDAGKGSGFSDQEYEEQGAEIVSAEEAWNSEFIFKVKEPLQSEYPKIREGQTIFTYFHLAGVDPKLTDVLLEKKVTSIAYETVEDHGTLPLLMPMSAVAGKMAVQVGAHYLAKTNGGCGVLLEGIPGVAPAKVVIIGGGVVGKKACKTAIGRGASVTLFDVDINKLWHLEDIIGGRFRTFMSNRYNLEYYVSRADLVIGAVLVPGAAAPKVITAEMIKSMKPGSVIVDVAIDQGGCCETSKPTSHEKPVFEKHGVIHYCVTNMPAAYPRTSTIGLTNSTLPYAVRIAKLGVIKAVNADPGLAKGVNTYKGKITYKAVSDSMGRDSDYCDLNDLI